MARRRIGVVHLVRRGNGTPPLERFVAAYRRHAPGIEHDLLVLFKGFLYPGELASHRERLAGLHYRELKIPDTGYDIGSYERAFRHFAPDYDAFCFLNSFAEPLREGWLAMLYRQALGPGVGLVGATGSWQSIAGSYERRLHVERLRTGHGFSPIAALLRKPAFRLVRWWRKKHFADFPNPHVRTNGFFAPRAVLSSLVFPDTRRKMHAYRFESGRTGLTTQVLGMGRRVLLAGADEQGYEVPEWHSANVFWRAEQENLLIADNQTRAYASCDSLGRSVLSFYAWGDRASPAGTTRYRSADTLAASP